MQDVATTGYPEQFDEIACDHVDFIECLDRMGECNLWVAMDEMLRSPQGVHVYRHGSADIVARLDAIGAAVADIIKTMIAQGKPLVDDILPGHPITDYILSVRPPPYF